MTPQGSSYLPLSTDGTCWLQWKPSCKHGGAKFSYSGVITSSRVFHKPCGLPADFKKTRVRLTSGEFSDKVAEDVVSTSNRYGCLEITGKHVTIRWKDKDQSFTSPGPTAYGARDSQKWNDC